ncbi:MAG: ABC transporter ATP-binding protein [Polyangiales bacterium]
MLTIADVHKSFAGHPVVRGLSLTVGARETWILRGKNGSGKSTLCEMIAGVIDPDRGRIEVARAYLGYAPSSAVLPDTMFLHDWIDLVASLKGASALAVDAAIAHWELETCTDSRLSALSLGQRKRLALACAELGEPRLLVLDEPTVGLDDDGRALLVTWIRAHVEGGGAALIATHDDSLIGPLGARTVDLVQATPRQANGRG